MRPVTAALLVTGAAVVVAAEFVVIGLLPEMAGALGMTPARAGWLITAFALASALLGPPLVVATARWPAAPLLTASLLPFAANLLLPALPEFPFALALRVLQGAALPLFISVAGVQLGAAFGTGRGVALLYLGVTIGGTLAPPAGSFLAGQFGWQGPMAAIGLLALATALGCHTVAGRARGDRVPSPWRLIARPSLQAHLLLSVLTFAAMFTGFSFIAPLLGRAGLTGGGIAIALLAFGAAGLGGNWLAGRLAAQALPATPGAALAVALMTVLVEASPGPAATGMAVLGWGMAHAAAFVFCQVRVMAAAPEAAGFAGSLNIAAANIGIALGSFTGGIARDRAGAPALAGMVCAFAALAIIAACLCRPRNVTQPSS